ncbi:ubiquitin domain-containing protein 7SL RNA1-like [Punica granatum]|uniref:Ubiquitin-like domain-containing protein n=2 Tax=Punica granatum TaxID=22663 RepID=A0A218WZ88_PUNGR|nr:ubiquitin domain-containing protein 7SL RNA1-like [Punica granatum]OWM77670.1 hypothetical protein CDL15_Pgr017070 [Punica granatum]PKI40196.1 hypothetical protein CRG98_039389 [Punica granatum]
MEVFIDPTDGGVFSIEIGFFETVRDMKERIEATSGIPVSSQTLLFNGEVLDDDGKATYLGIKENSSIQLQVANTQSGPTFLRLRIRIPSHTPFLMEVNRDDLVRDLKEKIQARVTSLPADRLALQVYNVELQDNLSVYECGLINDVQVDVFVKPQLVWSSGGSGSGSGKLTVKVLPWGWNKKIIVEVSKSDKVEELRGELERLQEMEGFVLPAEYFFIHKQSVMVEDETFQLNGVNQGDTIEVFRGKVASD